MKRLCPGLLRLLLLVSLAAPALLADSLMITNLGAALQTATGYTGKSYSMYINDSGEVAGKVYTNGLGATYYTFLYDGTNVQSLGTFTNPAGGNNQPTGLNSSGEVSGFAYNSASARQAFLYESGLLSDLGQTGGTNSYGYGITDSGMVVGTTTIAAGNSNNDLFTYSNNTMTDDNRPAGAVNVANVFVNNSGQIAGNSDAAGGQAFYYSPTNYDPSTTNGGFSAITLPGGGTTSTAASIGASGQVIGQAAISTNVQQAFLYTPATSSTASTTVDLGTAWSAGNTNPYIGASDALAMNLSGEVVGDAYVTANNYHAVIFSNGVMTDLGTLNGLADSEAVAVNDNGWVVGYATNTALTISEAFLYVPPSMSAPTGEMIDLSAVASGQGFAELLTATGINDSDQIIGQGQIGSSTFDAYILKYAAVPEPSTKVSMGLGLVLCAAGIRKSRRRLTRPDPVTTPTTVYLPIDI